MDERILVEVYVPAAQLYWDVYVPLFIKVQEVLDILKNWMQKLSDGMYVPSSSTCLYVQKTGAILPLHVYVKDSGVRSGDCIILL